METQETLTGSTFDHLFSFLLSLTVSLGRLGLHVKSKTQKSDHLQFAQIVHANSHPGEKLCHI